MKIRLRVGDDCFAGGVHQDFTRRVEFEGELLARRTILEGPRPRERFRGISRRLFQTADGKYLVHSIYWSKHQNEWTRRVLEEASPQDLDVGGRFEALGRAAGLARSLTLEEALDP